jgi:hypothetical protein
MVAVFVVRAARLLSRTGNASSNSGGQGIQQFVHMGSSLPTQENIHRPVVRDESASV